MICWGKLTACKYKIVNCLPARLPQLSLVLKTPKMIRKHYFYFCFRAFRQCIRAQKAPKLIALIFFVQLATDAPAAALQEQAGVVTRVVDGDTLWVKTRANAQPLKVRIQGIDAPEICQLGGVPARDALRRMTLGQSVTVTSKAHDDYGRTIGIVHLQGHDIGRWMVAQGHAWAYTYRHKKGPYAEEFQQAQSARRGIFISDSENPRLFRKRHGSCHPP